MDLPELNFSAVRNPHGETFIFVWTDEHEEELIQHIGRMVMDPDIGFLPGYAATLLRQIGEIHEGRRKRNGPLEQPIVNFDQEWY